MATPRLGLVVEDKPTELSLSIVKLLGMCKVFITSLVAIYFFLRSHKFRVRVSRHEIWYRYR